MYLEDLLSYFFHSVFSSDMFYHFGGIRQYLRMVSPTLAQAFPGWSFVWILNHVTMH